MKIKFFLTLLVLAKTMQSQVEEDVNTCPRVPFKVKGGGILKRNLLVFRFACLCLCWAFFYTKVCPGAIFCFGKDNELPTVGNGFVGGMAENMIPGLRLKASNIVNLRCRGNEKKSTEQEAEAEELNYHNRTTAGTAAVEDF